MTAVIVDDALARPRVPLFVDRTHANLVPCCGRVDVGHEGRCLWPCSVCSPYRLAGRCPWCRGRGGWGRGACAVCEGSGRCRTCSGTGATDWTPSLLEARP